MKKPLVGIVILTWNGKEDTLECLKSLRHIDYPNCRTYVADNGSADGTAAAVREAFPDVVVIETGENLGFAGGNNVAIRQALDEGVEAILLLNNDTIVDPAFLSIMADALYRSPDIGATNPTIYYYDEPTVIWSAGGTVDGRTGIAYQRRLEEVDRGQALPEMDVDYGIGAALLIRRETLEKAGLLDPSFFIYYEETDWCFRARECGYRVVYVPSAKIWHKVSRSMRGASELSLYYFCRNRLLFLKNRRTSRARLLRIAALEFGRMSAAYAIHGEQKQSRAVRRAVFDFFNRRFGKVSL